MAANASTCERWIGRIPVRNLWLLMLYASDLIRTDGLSNILVDSDIDDVADIVAQLLANSVEHRLRRNLTRGYERRETVLTRVRGRIDILRTESSQLLSRGEVFCRFEELTIDTPRNRFIRAALALLTHIVRDDELSHRCRALSYALARAGVGGKVPTSAALASVQMGRNDHADRVMIALAELAFDLALPTEEAGPTSLAAPEREEIWVRRLFEKAILGFAQAELRPLGCAVRGSIPLEWQIQSASTGLAAILPRMSTDIILDSPTGRRLVVDTKFTSILTAGRFRETSLKSGYLYQMYAYLRSQEGRSHSWESASGLFLHPAVHGNVREQVTIQNHSIAFATVDLGASTSSIRNELRSILLTQMDCESKGIPYPTKSTPSPTIEPDASTLD